MKQRLKLLSLVLTLFLICTLFSCANSTDENPNKETSLIDQDNIDITNETPSNETEEQPSDATGDEQMKNQAIFADLNHDGTDDKILITYEDEQKNSATIKVINGNDGLELMSDSLELDTNKVGAYYLQKGKGNERDRLVFWHYGYLESGKLAFNYSVFSYEPDGKITYGDRGGRTFDVSYDAAIASGHQVFLVMIKEINENIQASRSIFDCYLLLDNQGDSLLISTAENMLTPTDLLFELEDFAVEANVE